MSTNNEAVIKQLEDQFLEELKYIFILTPTGLVASSKKDRERMNHYLKKYEELFKKYDVKFFLVEGDGRTDGRTNSSQMYHNSLILKSHILRQQDSTELEEIVASVLEANRVLQDDILQLKIRNNALEDFVRDITDRFNRFSIGSSSTDVEQEEEEEEDEDEEEQEEQQEEEREEERE